MTDDQSYLADLERALRRRGLDEDRTAEIVREMADHLAESGDRPLDAFGDPEAYAVSLLAADQPAAEADDRYESHTFRATASDELDILARLGLEGWELTGVRDFGLHARRPLDQAARRTWKYERCTALRRAPVLARMEAEGWTECGRWLTFHYFKRPEVAEWASSVE